MSNPNVTNGLVNDLRTDDPETFDRLIAHTYRRLKLRAHHMLRTFGDVRLKDQTGDVLHKALYRFQRALPKIKLKSDRHFYHLVGKYIRWVLLDLARRSRGPQASIVIHLNDSSGGALARAADPATGPDNLLPWEDLLLKAKELPPNLREVFDLIFCKGKGPKEAAEILGVSERTVKRWWLAVRLALGQACNGKAPNN
jgi:RNA polymerase sigma factor (sigma-70 family)